MKKLIAILTVAVVVTFTTSTANAFDGISISNKKVMESFEREFAGAANVTWYTGAKENYVAKFTIKSSKVTAHFDRDGNLLATSRYITDSELPLNVITKLMKKYPDQNIHNIVEYEAEGSTTYMITLESDSHWTTVKATDHSVSTYRKLKKA